jgi:uncharacterized membrane protein YdjX (TVP38/TMEM64 family)
MEAALQQLARMVSELGPFGLVALAAVFFIGSLTFVPRPPLCMIGGLVFGLPAFPVALLASTLGAVAGFLMSRYVFRTQFRNAVERRAAWKKILHAIESQGWVLVGLLRLASPVPGSATTYLFGLTSIRLWPYAFATLLGLAPQTFAFVYLGAAGRLAVAGPAMPAVKLALLIAGAFTSALVVWLVVRRARASLATRLDHS